MPELTFSWHWQCIACFAALLSGHPEYKLETWSGGFENGDLEILVWILKSGGVEGNSQKVLVLPRFPPQEEPVCPWSAGMVGIPPSRYCPFKRERMYGYHPFYSIYVHAFSVQVQPPLTHSCKSFWLVNSLPLLNGIRKLKGWRMKASTQDLCWAYLLSSPVLLIKLLNCSVPLGMFWSPESQGTWLQEEENVKPILI